MNGSSVTTGRPQHSAAAGYLLEVRDVVKSFGGTIALGGVSFGVAGGRVLALLGENGAGKSTLVRILAGVDHPDSGSVHLRGDRPGTGGRARMSVLHQDLALVETMTVAENIALGPNLGYGRNRGLISWRATKEQAQRHLATLGTELAPEALVGDLPRAERSLVALARCLAVQPDIVVLDEPTASLEKSDVDRLFDALRHLRAQGVAQIFVSHRIDEVLEISDEFVVLRNGLVVGAGQIAGVSSDDLVEQITGKRPDHGRQAAAVPAERPVLVVSDAVVGEVGPVSFTLHEGEILGMVGLRGAGQEQVARFLSGQARLAAGAMTLEGAPFGPRNPRAALQSGAVFVTGNRETAGVAPSMTVRENLLLNPWARGRRVFELRSTRAERGEARALVESFGVRPAAPEMLVSELSGGNQQKVVLARSLSLHKRLIVLEDPTLGVDVGAREAIYDLLRQAVAQGACVVLVSSDFEEVAKACDRALVFNRGRVTESLAAGTLSIANLVKAAQSAGEG
jgi:ribose transport system ATP-binding protein